VNRTTGIHGNAFPERATRVSDPASGLEARLTISRGSDGGASAVDVALRNASAEHDVVLKVNSELSAFIMLTITDDEGTVLSKPARRFDTSEVQRFVTTRISRGSSQTWPVPIHAQLDASAIPERGLKGRLVVNVALLFSKVSGDGEPADGDLDSSLVTLYDMDVLFSRAALTEGTGLSPAGR
jgi:hypothetical protein